MYEMICSGLIVYGVLSISEDILKHFKNPHSQNINQIEILFNWFIEEFFNRSEFNGKSAKDADLLLRDKDNVDKIKKLLKEAESDYKTIMSKFYVEAWKDYSMKNKGN
jgi:hypothetical protein